MSKSPPGFRRSIAASALLLLFTLILSACGTPTPTPRPPEVPTAAPQVKDTPAPAPTATAQPSSSGGDQGGASGGTDISTWQQVSRSASGTTYSYSYPPGWTSDLSYCAPGAARNASGNLLPARCASTDILVGQKAKDVGTLTGDSVTLNGKQAIKQIDRAPRNGQAQLIYTVLVYDPSGTPLAGFSTSIGPNTDQATSTNIVSMLDQVAGTLQVDK
jgi:hypothetical protein